MIVCCCQAVTERDLDAAIASGANSVDAVGQLNGAGTDCGCCLDTIEQRIAERCGGDCATCPRASAERGRAPAPGWSLPVMATAA